MTDGITSKSRVLTAIDHKTTDRVPITFDAEKEVYEALYKHLKLTSKEDLFDALHVDTWMVIPPCHPSSLDRSTTEATSVWGYRTRQATYQGGTYHELCYSPLAGKDELQDVDAHPWPDVDVYDFSAFPQDIATHSDRAVIGVFTWGAYFLATHIRGMENILLDFACKGPPCPLRRVLWRWWWLR